MNGNNLLYSLHMPKMCRNEDQISEILHVEDVCTPRPHTANLLVCGELKALKEAELCQRKRSQQLRASNVELRELQKQLNVANHIKAVNDQIKFLEKRKKEAQAKALEESRNAKIKQKETIEKLNKLKEDEQRKAREYRHQLDEQLKNATQKRKAEIQQILLENENIERSLKKLDADLAKKYERYLELKQELHDDMMQSLRDAENKKQTARLERLIDENAIIAEMMRQRDEIKRQLELQKLRTLAERQNISEELGTKLKILELERQQREEVLTELLGRERLAKEQAEWRERLEKEKRNRLNYINDLEHCRKDRILMAEQHKAEEKHLHEQQREYYAELEKKSQILNENRRKKCIADMQSTKQYLEIRRQQRINESVQNVIDQKLNDEQEREKQLEIAKERRQMLFSQPAEVYQYLMPAHIRQSERELVDAVEKLKEVKL